MAILFLIGLVVVLLWNDRQRVKSGLSVLPGEYWSGVSRQDSTRGGP